MEHKGRRLTIRFCEAPGEGEEPGIGQLASWQESMTHFKQGKHMQLEARFMSCAEKLADTGQLRLPDHWNPEGELPNGKRFYAIKPDRKLRAYGWYSSRYKGVFYVSHFAFKKGEKLDQKDTNRVCRNWRSIEEQQ